MGILTRYLWLPRPRTFLYVMSLRTGVEMVSLSMIFNKLTGFYGLLAILTGVSLSPLQLSMYIYSVGALALLAFLMPFIRKQSPFECLALAWFYLFDTVINTAFTSAFAVTWFLAVSADNANKGIPSSAPGASTIDSTAGFTSPKYNVSKVDVITHGQDTVAFGTAGTATATAASPNLGHGVGIEESIPSILVVIFLTMVRAYFILIVMAFARQVVRQHMYAASSAKLHLHTDGTAEGKADNPFAAESPEGAGWKGKLGRIMVKAGEGYWLGGQADDEWAKGLDGRFKTTRLSGAPPGTIERERRARSGTGPPNPKLSIDKV
ncbi:hypothetical protein QTJ16_006414 [Diplocarpon rosae]|uniref:DUF1753-domain-containing protein n=1 Tax=Diplocarpon rosae TaxID=946125 RepID=A0AAD9SWK8_9HELO|nr:hypothetical protein QTJ16_006414 [Diplocarpon rosae]PBP28064.1 hypothetical protein BUE80_DR000869 [Diplocarpon rosae]